MNAAPRRRPVIGLLLNTLYGGYEESIWRSVVRVAEELDVDLLCFLGGALAVDPRSGALLELAHPSNVDGLVVMSSSVGICTGPAVVAARVARIGVPAVSLSEPLAGQPSVLVDNEPGIREAVEHLVDVHGRRRIAFVRGPPHNSDANARFAAYRNALSRLGLPYDPEVVVDGDFSRNAGVRAVRILLDERRASFDALFASNDDMALAALDELRRRGIDVPGRVAVCGFDDEPDAMGAVPPLTTVRQPLDDLARRAVELLLARIRGEPVPAEVTYPTKLVTRRTCGCSELAAGAPLDEPERRGGVRASLAERLERDLPGFGARIGVPTWAEALQAALETPPSPGGDEPFLRELDRLLSRAPESASEPGEWFRVLRTVLAWARGQRSPDQGARLTSLCLAAHSLIGARAPARQLTRRFRTEQELRVLLRLVQPFPIRDDSFTRNLLEALRELDVRSFFLSRFRSDDRREAVLVAHLDQDGVAELEEPPTAFAPERLLPGRFSGRRRAHAVLPVHSPAGLLGFALCEIGPMSSFGYEMLVHDISMVLSVNGLVAEVRDQHRQLLETARQAGMAEVAVGALRDVGNLLNSVSVSAREIRSTATATAAIPEASPAVAAEVERIQAESLELLEKTALIRESLRNLQDHARGGREPLVREEVEIAEVVRAVVEIERAHLDRYGVEVRLEVAPVAPVVVPRARLVHVLVNLVKNAVDAMRGAPEGRRLLVIAASRQEDGRIRLEVRDTGEGIPPENLRRVFSYGFSTRADGHGFGLYTCDTYLKQMGGSIEVHSDGVGRGATFTLHLGTGGRTTPPPLRV